MLKSHRQPASTPRAFHGHSTDGPWASHGHPTGCVYAAHGLPAGSPWVSHVESTSSHSSGNSQAARRQSSHNHGQTNRLPAGGQKQSADTPHTAHGDCADKQPLVGFGQPAGRRYKETTWASHGKQSYIFRLIFMGCSWGSRGVSVECP